MALAMLKPLAEPWLKKHGLTWEDILPLLEMVDSVDELRQAAANPEAFLNELASKGGPVAKKMALAMLKPLAEPWLKKHGLTWEDILPVLEMVDSVDELRQAAANPEAFLGKLVAAVPA